MLECLGHGNTRFERDFGLPGASLGKDVVEVDRFGPHLGFAAEMTGEHRKFAVQGLHSIGKRADGVRLRLRHASGEPVKQGG
jgi:hypothetical protein